MIAKRQLSLVFNPKAAVNLSRDFIEPGESCSKPATVITLCNTDSFVASSKYYVANCQNSVIFSPIFDSVA